MSFPLHYQGVHHFVLVYHIKSYYGMYRFVNVTRQIVENLKGYDYFCKELYVCALVAGVTSTAD